MGTNDRSKYDGTPNIADEILSFSDCMENLTKHDLFKEKYENASRILQEISKNVKQQIEKQAWLENLAPILQETCYLVIDRTAVYNLTIDLLILCSKKEVPSTPEKILNDIERLRQRTCYISLGAGNT